MSDLKVRARHLVQAAAREEVAKGGSEAGERGLADNGLREAARSRHCGRVGHCARHRGLCSSAQALHPAPQSLVHPPLKDRRVVPFVCFHGSSMRACARTLCHINELYNPWSREAVPTRGRRLMARLAARSDTMDCVFWNLRWKTYN